MSDAANVHDLGADHLAALLEDLFSKSSKRAHLYSDGHQDLTRRRPLVREDFEDHIAGRYRLGAIPFVEGSRTWWGCIDIDARNFGLEPDDPEVFELINRVMEALGAHGIRAALERSKGKGWHIWVFFDAPIDAARVRAFLRSVALGAGIPDASDLVCPRQDHEGDVGNGTWLPLCGMDREPNTRFYELDADSGDWLPASNQAAVVRELIERPNPTSAVPSVEAEQRTKSEAPGDHGCTWIVDELDEIGVALEHLAYHGNPKPELQKISFGCPFHRAPKQRTRGGSAVFFSTGSGWCASAKCGKKWRTVAEFVDALELAKKPSLRVLTPEEFERDVAPASIVDTLIYHGSTHSLPGASKAGKSWFVFQMIMCIATGRPFLGLAVEQCVALLLSLELSAGMVRERMNRIHEDVGIPMPRIGSELHVVAPTAEYVPRIDLATQAGADELARVIEQTGAHVVVLDTLYRFLSRLGSLEQRRDGGGVRSTQRPRAQQAGSP